MFNLFETRKRRHKQSYLKKKKVNPLHIKLCQHNTQFAKIVDHIVIIFEFLPSMRF